MVADLQDVDLLIYRPGVCVMVGMGLMGTGEVVLWPISLHLYEKLCIGYAKVSMRAKVDLHTSLHPQLPNHPVKDIFSQPYFQL